MQEQIVIYEWKSLRDEPNKFSEDERIEITKSFRTYSSKITKNKTIGDFKTRNIVGEFEDNIRNRGNNVGIIEFKDNRLELRPKFDRFHNDELFWRFFPKMLNTLCDLDGFNQKLFLDPTKNIKLPKGCNIAPLLALSFASLCRSVIEKGLIKKYIKKNERLKSLKGRINFNQLAKNRAWDLSSIPCSYFDLTFDNSENQIILWCAHKLLRETRVISQDNNIYVIKKLREQYSLLSNEISLIPKTKKDLNGINLSGIADYYVELMNLCKAILEESLFSFDKEVKKKNTGINFIIDMDWVFEQYMTYLFKKVIAEINNGKEILTLESQYKQNLCDKNKIRIKPDLVIFKNKLPISIIDFKWKIHEKNNNADFYQVICYGLAELQKHPSIKKISTNLFSVSHESEDIVDIDSISKIFNDNKSLFIKKIPLNVNLLNNENPDKIEENIKGEIRRYLDNFT